MRVKIAAGHEYDLVSSQELSAEMKELRHRFDEMWRQEVRGIKQMEGTGPGPNTSSFTFPGPEQGFAWSVKIAAVTLSAADLVTFYKGTAVTSRPIATLVGSTSTTSNSPAIVQPAVPASGTAVYNNNPFVVAVTVSGGTVSQIAVNGTNTGLTTGVIYVPANGTITLTYTVAPTWSWANATSTQTTTVVGQIRQVATWSSHQAVLRSGEEITAVTSGAGNIASYYFAAVQVPAERVGILLA